ncbi:MAG: Tmc redox complex protein TmcD [Desulfobacter sp.]|nr:MAG: Tmc redox complex protein TmcD [Desulfobacter sp.]
MEEKQSWDWSTQLKEIPVKEWESRFNWVEDPCITPDGESVAAIVNVDEMAFGICVNGELWEGEHEKAWSLKAMPDGRLAVCACQDEEWSLVVDGTPWSNQFDFIWDLKASPDGSIGLAFQRDMEYGMAVEDQPWEENFEQITQMVLGRGGKTAAVVQVDSMAAADVDAFSKGLFSVAVNGEALEERFLNIWDLCFDQDGQSIAWAARFDREKYGIAVDGKPWDGRYQAVWRPMFCNGDGGSKSVVAPVRTGGKWYLYKDNQPLWASGYENIWRLAGNAANTDIAAVVATTFGRWSVARNDRPWTLSWDTMVRDIYFSGDGSSLAAVFKNNGVWGVAQDDKAWQLSCDKVFTPDMTADGSVVAVSYEKDGRFFTAVNDKVVTGPYEYMADPVVSPEGDKVLVKGIEDGIYKRRIIAL